MPSTAGWAWGICFTGWETRISLTFATLMPYRLSLIVNSMTSISFVPDSSKMPRLSSSNNIPNTPFSGCLLKLNNHLRAAVAPDAGQAGTGIKQQRTGHRAPYVLFQKLDTLPL